MAKMLLAALCALAVAAGTAPAATGGWTVLDTPTPSGYAAFDGVSCWSEGGCIAVGNTRNGKALAEIWNGTSWAIQKTPKPSRGSFAGVSCWSGTGCIAVGSTSPRVPVGGSSNGKTLAEIWNGHSWKVQNSKNGRGGGGYVIELDGVSCWSHDRCIAVGQSGGQALAEVWNGRSWKIQKTPHTTGGGALESVSCWSGAGCIAGGVKSRPVVELAEGWNGHSWKIQKTPKGRDTVGLVSVSCWSPRGCLGVGVHTEKWNGHSWRIQKSPNLFSHEGISCWSSSGCIAVGEGRKRLTTGAEIWNGQSWTVQPTPSLAAGSGWFEGGVSCWAETGCIAVGDQGYWKTLAENWSPAT